MAGFDSSFPATSPVIEMAGFGSRKYRLTVSRLTLAPWQFAAATSHAAPSCISLFAGLL
jgi:hypothetical protein